MSNPYTLVFGQPPLENIGYSFAFQTIGYFTFENPSAPEKAERDAKVPSGEIHRIREELRTD